jgi:hypothetical protein
LSTGFVDATDNGGGNVVSGRLELSKDMKNRLAELRALSDQAEGGDPEARRELRKAVRESSPEVVARASDFAKRAQRILIETAAAGEPLMEEAFSARLDLMRAEVAGENPTALEVLLTERVVSSWLLLVLLEGLMSAQLKCDSGLKRPPVSYLKFILGWIESTHRRYLSAIRELARVRKLQSNVPRIQYNTQVNLSSDGSTGKE